MPEIARRLNTIPNAPFEVTETEGILIIEIVPNGPAECAGLRQGDVIFDTDGTAIERAEQLQDLVENSRIGQALRVKVRHNGRTQTQTLTLRPTEMQDFAP